MDNKLIVSSSPHVRSNQDTSYIMKQVVIDFTTCYGISSILLYRLSALNVIFFCTVGSVGFEFLYQKLTKQECYYRRFFSS